MIVKIVTFFLIVMAALAAMGRLRWPGTSRRIGSRRSDTPKRPGKCPKCGAYRVGSGPCPCEKGR